MRYKLEFGSVAIGLVVSLLWANSVRNNSAQVEAHHSIACRFQLEGFLIGIEGFKTRTGRFPSKLIELYPIELNRPSVCPFDGSSYDTGYKLADGSEDFILRCPTGKGPVFTSKDMQDLVKHSTR